ncbi:MAG: tRNA 5-methoxyuridine(34)/uridine 5-oxyacetic acid(34) synthase CmoB [Pseudomonadota bacterium]|nr:tRNA 5-methoxyuridine(34)/uridine 5-oxyacetic acid(34) synthase CmoB [Pseudomonadota bacterium]
MIIKENPVEKLFMGGLPAFFDEHLSTLSASAFAQQLYPEMVVNLSKMGNAASYARLLRGLPCLEPAEISEDGAVIIGSSKTFISKNDFNAIKEAIKRLIPWRKGPFNFFGLSVDSEWDSEQKWNRLSDHIQPLTERLVLDIGSGNGYFAWRMYLSGARAVVCLEPSLQSLVQFHFCKYFLQKMPVEMLPIKSDRFMIEKGSFDTVFSMGVLYHCRKPKEHLKDCRKNLRPGGELVLETLINNSDKSLLLVPSERYAGMRNVWSIPSQKLVKNWLIELGFCNPRCINQTTTTLCEQKTTEFMPYNSLQESLSALDSTKTLEGFDRPVRGIFLATIP